jgi:hypothetical protein
VEGDGECDRGDCVEVEEEVETEKVDEGEEKVDLGSSSYPRNKSAIASIKRCTADAIIWWYARMSNTSKDSVASITIRGYLIPFLVGVVSRLSPLA